MPIIRALRAMDQPVIAAVNGVAAGAGASLAFACDLRLAAPEARFVLAFGRIGLVPDCGATWFLPRLVGLVAGRRDRARRRSGRRPRRPRDRARPRVVPADELLGRGAGAGATGWRPGRPQALGWTKPPWSAAWSTDLETALEEEARLQGLAGATRDHAEGLAAFREKRAPRFTGRVTAYGVATRGACRPSAPGRCRRLLPNERSWARVPTERSLGEGVAGCRDGTSARDRGRRQHAVPGAWLRGDQRAGHRSGARHPGGEPVRPRRVEAGRPVGDRGADGGAVRERPPTPPLAAAISGPDAMDGIAPATVTPDRARPRPCRGRDRRHRAGQRLRPRMAVADPGAARRDRSPARRLRAPVPDGHRRGRRRAAPSSRSTRPSPLPSCSPR